VRTSATTKTITMITTTIARTIMMILINLTEVNDGTNA
jgi:hypothetical protein